MAYVPLWTKSNYSFLEGASHPPELVERAHQLGLPAIALTDRDGVYGIVRAHVRARELGIPLVIGAQITVGDDPSATSRVVVLARDREGYGALCRLISLGRACQPKGSSLVGIDAEGDELAQLAAGVVEDAERDVLRADELGCGPDDAVEHR